MAGFHKFNKELTTSNLNPHVMWFKVTVTNGSGVLGTVTQSKGNFIESITHNGNGNYTVQMTRPYPAGVIAVLPVINRADATHADRRVDYDAGTYSATAGTFVLFVSGPTGVADTTPIAVVPPSGAEIHVMLVFHGRKATLD